MIRGEFQETRREPNQLFEPYLNTMLNTDSSNQLFDAIFDLAEAVRTCADPTATDLLTVFTAIPTDSGDRPFLANIQDRDAHIVAEIATEVLADPILSRVAADDRTTRDFLRQLTPILSSGEPSWIREKAFKLVKVLYSSWPELPPKNVSLIEDELLENAKPDNPDRPWEFRANNFAGPGIHEVCIVHGWTLNPDNPAWYSIALYRILRKR